MFRDYRLSMKLHTYLFKLVFLQRKLTVLISLNLQWQFIKPTLKRETLKGCLSQPPSS
jgi:hypothetical protein